MGKTLELNTLDGRKIEVAMRDFKALEVFSLGFKVQRSIEVGDNTESLHTMYRMVVNAAESWTGMNEAFSKQALQNLLDSDLAVLVQLCEQVGAIVHQQMVAAFPVPAYEQPEDGVVH